MDRPFAMLDDARTITMVNDNIGGQNIAVVGSDGITKIVCYGEPGDGAYKPWLAVYRGDHLAYRMDTRGLTIYYAEPASGVLMKGEKT